MTTPFPFVANTVLTAAQLNAVTTLPVNARTANYTLVVGDVGYRVQMTNAGSTTITVNTGIFSAGDTIWIQNMGAGTCTITAGTATVGTASSLALAQYGGGTLVFQSASAATFFSQQAATYGAFTGGTALPTPPAGYTGASFTTDSNLVVTRAGLFDCLLVGGGGGGGITAGASYCGGGGGGGVTVETIYLAAATYSVDVGAGGAKQRNGLSSRLTASLTSLTAVGGGRGGGAESGFTVDSPTVGGSGGGGLATGASAQAYTGALGSQGFSGGNGVTTNGQGAGGGGGGSANGAAGSGTVGGAGGAGYDATSFVGTSTTYAGGGGGGGASGGAGGSGGGGGRATNGTANTGGGGGGNNAVATDNAGTGGSGIVIVRTKS